jgi:hypothetical protein
MKDEMKQTQWHADPLAWGHGPRLFEVFHEPTCPFSVKAFGKLDALLEELGEDRITIKLHLQSQPCHSILASSSAASSPPRRSRVARRRQNA